MLDNILLLFKFGTYSLDKQAGLATATQTINAAGGFDLPGWIMDSNNIIFIIVIGIFFILLIKSFLGSSWVNGRGR